MPGKNDGNPNGNETDMTNKMQVLPHQLSFRFFRIFSAILGAVSLVILLFAFVRWANTASAERSPVLVAVNQGGR
jgi:hypothetical protein